MNYKESKKILEKIEKSKNIIVSSHKGPDADTTGCALSLYIFLKDMGKKVTLICPNDLQENLKFLPHTEKFETVDFTKFDFSPYDLLIAVDTPSPDYLTGSKSIPLPDIDIVVIDHHKTNPRYGKINLVDDGVSSSAEVLFKVLQDWGADFDKKMATTLLAGILGDTNVFRYPSVTSETFDIARKLMDKGADKNDIVFNLFATIEPIKLTLWGEILRSLEIDKEHGFAWSAISNEVYKKYKGAENARESAASNFGQIIMGTEFSIIMAEEKKKYLSCSFRSRTDFDVSEIASRLGGGGHQAAAGAKVHGMEFEKAVEKVLDVARQVINENKKSS